MKISYIWLGEWVEHKLSPEEMAAGLTSLGLETSIAEDRRGAYANVVVGKVLTVGPHPNADSIRLTTVNAGGETLSIVCGAPNVAAGQTVAVALVGASLPNGMKIEERKIRGEASFGMICSETELGISSDSSGIMVLDSSLVAGTKLSACMELEDVIFEVDLTPNRGDCLGVLGVAREVAAVSGGKLKMPSVAPAQEGINGLSIKIENVKGCPRYTAREIFGVKITPSPFKIRRRLAACGVRPINNVVDATNYVMLETGQPLHAFDRRDIAGGIITVRNAAQGESFTTLDGKTHALEDFNLLIADASRGVALAGVMGGQNSEIKDDTADIILEAAYFDPVCVRRTAKRLGVSTESSYRFERGVDAEGLPLASFLAARMMAQFAGGIVGGYLDVYPQKIEHPPIALRARRTNDMLGLELSDREMAGYLGKLGIECESGSAGLFAVKTPSHRHDIKSEIDLVEEISRLHGLANVPPTAPKLAQHASLENGKYAKRRALNNLFAAAGFYEAVNFSFINPAWRRALGMEDKKPAKMENRINAELSELRTSLLPGLLQTASFNLRQGEERVTVYETGTTFRMRSGELHEEFHTAGVMTCGEEEILGVKLPRDFHRLKGVLSNVIKATTGVSPEFVLPAQGAEHKFLYDHRQAEIMVGGLCIGLMGQIHPLALEASDVDTDMVCFEFSADALLGLPTRGLRVTPIPRLPGIKRDLALIVDERVEAGALVKTILETDPVRIRHCALFDLYQGVQVPEGKKSLAFRLFFLDTEKNLTDGAGDEIMAEVLARVKEKHSAVIRG